MDGQKFIAPALAATDVERAFDHLVLLKLTTSNIAMHLGNAWRTGLFNQLDTLLDPAEWDFSDRMPNAASFRTFLRMIVHNNAKRRPGLGATADGNVVAAWTIERDRLTVECLPGDKLRWVVVRYINGERVSSANTSPANLLRTFLAPYEPDRWFG